MFPYGRSRKKVKLILIFALSERKNNGKRLQTRQAG